MPCPLHDIKEASTLCPEWLEDKPFLPGVFHVQVQQQGSVIWGVRGEGVQIASWKYALPIIGDEGAADVLQHWVRPLVAPGIELAIQVDLL
jgi:hypothetical protein